MWGQMGSQGMGMSYGMGLVSLVWIGIVIWFVIFSVLVLGKMDKIIKLLEKK
jgi:hypothetical protein